jgi:pyruvate dehydrogenase E1 component alpha subunit
MKRDPIMLLRMHMQEAGELSEDELHAMDEEIKAVVQDAWDFADASPEPPLEALYEDVLFEAGEAENGKEGEGTREQGEPAEASAH